MDPNQDKLKMESKHDRRQESLDQDNRHRHKAKAEAGSPRKQHRGNGRRSPRRRSPSPSWDVDERRTDPSRRSSFNRRRRSSRERSQPPSSSEDERKYRKKIGRRRSRSYTRSRSRSQSRSRSRSRSRQKGRPDRRREERRIDRPRNDDHRRNYQADMEENRAHDRRRHADNRRSYSMDHARPRRQQRRRRHRHRRSRSSHSSFSSSSASSRMPRPRGVANPTRAGVVSDDDDALGSSHGPQHVQIQGGAATKSRGGPDHRSGKTEDAKRGENKQKRRRESAQSSSQNHDDTVGHFWGGPGTIVADTYRVERELGVGTFGRVVECLDLTKSRGGGRDSHRQQQPSDDGNNLVAIKMVRKVKRYYESALIEADIVTDVNRRGGPRGRGTSHFAVMYDAFNFRGHYCLVFESLGPSLYDILKRNKYQPFPIHYVRDFSRQLLEAIEFLHSFRLIHTDLKPENILVTKCREVEYGYQKLPESTRIKVIDFGGATYDDEKKSSVVNTRQYRAPEVILGCGWSMPSDLWSAGCILAELYQGDLLFATHDNLEHLALIESIIGPFSRRMLQRANKLKSPLARQAFDANGRHRMERVLSPDNASHVLGSSSLKSVVRKKKDAWFLNLLRKILVIDPENRSSARDALRNCFG